LPEIRFFNMGEITIAGRKVRALHHGMSGVPGLELFGPWEDGAEVKAAIVEAGKEFGLVQVGSRVYATNTLELHRDAVQPGQRVLLVDDLLATGGTIAASLDIVQELHGEPIAVAVLVELPALGGRARLESYGVDVISFISY
jgi:orotate phosphoribosyltransferase